VSQASGLVGGGGGANLVCVGDTNGALRLLRTPVLAASPSQFLVPTAHISQVAAVRFSSLPLPPSPTLHHQRPQGPVQPRTNGRRGGSMVASLGCGDNTLALWRAAAAKSRAPTRTPSEVPRGTPSLLRHDGSGKGRRLCPSGKDDFGPLVPPPATAKDEEGGSGATAAAAGTSGGGPASLVCFVCGVPAMLSAYVGHVHKCCKAFAAVQADEAARRAMPNSIVRAAPLGPATPAVLAVLASQRAHALGWASEPLPVPPVPPGLHQKFLKSLPHFFPTPDTTKAANTSEEEEEATPDNASTIEDTQALKSLTAVERDQANKDAERAFWQGNTLVCPHCLGRVHFKRGALHAKACTSQTATQRRRGASASSLVEARRHAHALTVTRPPSQTKPGTATAREALLAPQQPPEPSAAATAAAAATARKTSSSTTQEAKKAVPSSSSSSSSSSFLDYSDGGVFEGGRRWGTGSCTGSGVRGEYETPAPPPPPAVVAALRARQAFPATHWAPSSSAASLSVLSSASGQKTKYGLKVRSPIASATVMQVTSVSANTGKIAPPPTPSHAVVGRMERAPPAWLKRIDEAAALNAATSLDGLAAAGVDLDLSSCF